jgi:hypothetical protein
LIGSRPQKEDPVEDQEKRTEEELEDVEAHKKKLAQASDEAGDELAGDDDVEAHRRKSAQASDEPRDEAEGEDDFEAHRARKTQL